MSYIGATPGYAAFVTDQFSGNGSTTAFTMSVTPAGATSLIVAVSGVLQDPTTYAVAGTTLTFSAAPPTGTGNISVRYLGLPASGVTNTAYRTVTEFTATAGQTVFSLPSYTVGYLNVYQNGVLLGSTDYTATTGTGVTLATGATVGDLITTESFYISSLGTGIPNSGGSVSATNLDIGNTNGTGSVAVPSGTTAQRPIGANGQLRYNSTTNSFEGYADGAWGAIGGGGGGGAGAWQSVQTAAFTAVAGNAYPVDTTAAAVTVTLPASPAAGDYLVVTDYARTFGTNTCTLAPNGKKISGSTSNVILNTNGCSVNLVYLDTTQGWVAYSGLLTSPVASYAASYLLVAGGGAGGGAIYLTTQGGGGGAGGLLTGTTTLVPGTAYTVTVGAGGTGANMIVGGNGTASSGFTVSTVGGGGGGAYNSGGPGSAGGSGGGGATGNGAGGAGTTGQGYAGGTATPYGGNTPAAAGGGGGAGGIGVNGSGGTGGNGGNGVASAITGTSAYYAGGGGGGGYNSVGAGGLGGGAAAGTTGANGNNGAANTGGGGGGTGASTSNPSNLTGGNGGSGVVVLSYAGTQRGTGGTVTTSAGYTIHTFTSSGTFTA